MQSIEAVIGDEVCLLEIPDADEEVIPGICWGRSYEVFSPAFWFVLAQTEADPSFGFINPDGDLRQEVGFCLLGGFGVTAELATAAFERLRAEGIFEAGSRPTEQKVLALLTEPLEVMGRLHRYRFPNQRSKRISNAMQFLAEEPFSLDDPLHLRDKLMKINGVGPKTASWIVRNLTGSDEVAILDIHIIRACRLMSLFPGEIRLPRDYGPLEERFLEFAEGLGVGAAILDALIWTKMREMPRLVASMH